MKKMFLMAAVMCLAVAAQAAAFSWYTDDPLLTIASDTLASGLKANTTYALGGENCYDAGWTLAYTMVLNYGDMTDTLTGTATINWDGTINDEEGLESDLVAGDRTIDYTITYTANITDGKSQSWVVTGSESGVWTTDDGGFYGFNTAGPGSWTTNAVPEPTSGLLMLLGLAGLALTRKTRRRRTPQDSSPPRIDGYQTLHSACTSFCS